MPIDRITSFVVKSKYNNHTVINNFVKDDRTMKNFSVNLNNETASPGEKLISYNYAGGIYAVIIFIASVFGTASLIGTAAVVFGIDVDNFSPIPFSLSLLMFCLLFVTCAFVVIFFSIKQGKNINKGFEIYPEKVLFLDNIKARKPYSKRTLVFAIIMSLLFGLYYWYWLVMMVYNIRLLTHKKGSQVKESLCLLLVPFYHYVWMYTRGRQVREEFINRGLECSFVPGVLLFLDIIGLGMVSVAIMQHHINHLNEERVLTEKEYKDCIAKNTYSFSQIKRINVVADEFIVEGDESVHSIKMTSRDFRDNLKTLIAYNT